MRPLAKHYGITGVAGPEWRRVDGMRKFGRGGILGQAAILSKQSGASRTSPILRGNWIAEVLLGDKLPRPPKDVPQLPTDEATESLVRARTDRKAHFGSAVRRLSCPDRSVSDTRSNASTRSAGGAITTWAIGPFTTAPH